MDKPPRLSKSAANATELEQLFQNQIRVNTQLTRTIWVLVNTSESKSVTVDEAGLDPLYELAYERPDPDQPTVIKISAKTMPEASEKQITELAARLKGKSCHPGDDMTAVGLGDYPFAYISKKLAPHVVLHDGGIWIERAEYDKLTAEKPKEIHLEVPPGTIPFPAQ